MGVALGALAVDRLFLQSGATTPSGAAADTGAAHASVLPAPAVEDGLRTPTLAQRLRDLAGKDHLTFDHVADAFRPVHAEPAHQEPIVQKAVEAPMDARAVFSKQHRLSGVFKLGEEVRVTIDGELRKVGESVDGWLIECADPMANPPRVVMARDGQSFEFELGKPRREASAGTRAR